MSNLRKYRESLNISQTTLAKAVGCTQGATKGGRLELTITEMGNE